MTTLLLTKSPVFNCATGFRFSDRFTGWLMRENLIVGELIGTSELTDAQFTERAINWARTNGNTVELVKGDAAVRSVAESMNSKFGEM